MVISEQYPERLGTTVPEIIKRAHTTVYSKKQFSMLTDEVKPLILENKRVVVCGIESHVCVLQTVMGLSALSADDTEIFVVCDAVSSQR